MERSWRLCVLVVLVGRESGPVARSLRFADRDLRMSSASSSKCGATMTSK